MEYLQLRKPFKSPLVGIKLVISPELKVSESASGEDRLINDLIRLAKQDILVEEGKTVRAVLSYSTIESEVIEYERRINSNKPLRVIMILLIFFCNWMGNSITNENCNMFFCFVLYTLFAQNDSLVKYYSTEIIRSNIIKGRPEIEVDDNEAHFKAIYHPSGRLKSIEFIPANLAKDRKYKTNKEKLTRLYYLRWDPKKTRIE